MDEPISIPFHPLQTPVDPAGFATVTEVMEEINRQEAGSQNDHFIPLPTGFDPLDDVLNGGLRRGELMVLGGAFGVGKTIFALQMARNMVHADANYHAMYICYEHDRSHLLTRLLCLESAESGDREDALSIRRLAMMSRSSPNKGGLIEQLRQNPCYRATLEAMESYADRLALVKAGSTSTVEQIRSWVDGARARGGQRLLVVVDYLQKIPVHGQLQEADEVTTYLARRLKDLAVSTGISLVAITAADHSGLQAQRMRLTDLSGSAALQYEADIGLVLNNKYTIVSREHMVYNLSRAQATRNWVVMSVEKNRSGRAFVDMEYQMDAVHFRAVPTGGFVRERLIDEKLVLA